MRYRCQCVVSIVMLAMLLLPMAGWAQGVPPHSADQDKNFHIALSELLRVIQFYNAGGLHCAPSGETTEDGYAPGVDPTHQECVLHDSDYDTEHWSISLAELLRLIQFFNSGSYIAECGSEDHFAPGPGDSTPCAYFGDFTDPQDVTGGIVLPAERDEALDTLVVSTATADWPVDATGSFAATVISDAPSLVIVLDGSGDPLLTGFVEPDDIAAGAMLDATSTAIALLYFALGGFLIPQENRAELLAEIEVAPELAALVAAIETSLSNGEYPLMADTGPVADAMVSASETLIARVQSEASKGEVARNIMPKDDTTLTNILIQPGGDVLQSGLKVLHADNGGVQVQNHFRRRSYYYAYWSSYKNAAGETIELDTPIRVGEPQKITTTAALGEVAGVLAAFDGSAPWAPFTVGPFDLPKYDLAPSVIQTNCELILVGCNLNPSSLPSDYPDPRYAGELDEWQSSYAYLQAETFFVDFVLSIVMLAATGAQSALQAKKVGGAIEDLKETFDPEFARIGLALPLDTPAEYKAAAKEALLLMRDNDIVRASTLNTLKSLWATSTSNKANLERLQTTLRNGTRMSAIVLAIETTITALDLGAVVKDLLNSNSVDVWDANVIDRVVRINPSEPEIEEGDTTITLRASVNGLPDEVFCYRWSLLPGSSGEIYTALEEGPEFLTKEDEITYFISPVDFDTGYLAQVSVEVFPTTDATFDCDPFESIGSRTVTVVGVTPPQDPCDENALDLTPYMQPSTEFITLDAPTLVRPGDEFQVTIALNWSAIDSYTVNPIDLSASLFSISGAGNMTQPEKQTSILVNGSPLVDSPLLNINYSSVGTVNTSPPLHARPGLTISGGVLRFKNPENGGSSSYTVTVTLDEQFANSGCVSELGGNIYVVYLSLYSIPNNSDQPDYDPGAPYALRSYRVDRDF